MMRGRASNLPGGDRNMERGALRSWLCGAALSALALPAVAPRAEAQTGCVARPRVLAAQTPRARIAQLMLATKERPLAQDALWCGADSVGFGYALRTPLGEIRAAVHAPVIRVSKLSGIADARDDGVMWSGRGITGLSTAGVSLNVGDAHAVFAPVVWASENRGFPFYPARVGNRSGFASPWYDGGRSIDLPSRYGARALRAAEVGESGWWIGFPYVDAGLSASTQSWGPGRRAHLLLGPDAPGIPRVFVRTARPVATRAGLISATAFAGTLRESPFFDMDPGNDQRWLRAWSLEIAIGPVIQAALSRALMSATLMSSNNERLTTLSVRAQSPDDGASVWLELGRMGALPSVRELLTVPAANLAYVIGFEHATRIGERARLLTSIELVNLEQPTAVQGTATQDFYTSSIIPQGWTHRGRLLGASTGPGSQSQFAALDYVARRWSVGVFGERVRWNEDAFLREYLAYANRHDVSVRNGVRVGLVALGYELEVEASKGRRFNYLFQNNSYIPDLRTVDIDIPQLRVMFAPAGR
jgi:hypothetical protein